MSTPSSVRQGPCSIPGRPIGVIAGVQVLLQPEVLKFPLDDVNLLPEVMAHDLRALTAGSGLEADQPRDVPRVRIAAEDLLRDALLPR